jgi:hypothetical protein
LYQIAGFALVMRGMSHQKFYYYLVQMLQFASLEIRNMRIRLCSRCSMLLIIFLRPETVVRTYMTLKAIP